MIPEFAIDSWLLTHPDLRTAARVRVLLDYLADALKKQRALLAGKGRSAVAEPA